jgi:hypothetical protein
MNGHKPLVFWPGHATVPKKRGDLKAQSNSKEWIRLRLKSSFPLWKPTSIGLNVSFPSINVHMTFEEKLAAFRNDLAGSEVHQLVQKHITFGDCFALSQDQYFELKSVVGQKFNLHTSQVLVVGSAKLGFSIVPDKRYRAFGETSDIDLVLCSSELFDMFWQAVFSYWARGETWDGLGDFRRYLFRGWMRPDKLPPAKSFERSQQWWDFFRELTASGKFGPYKISGALYKSWDFLEVYQEKCVRDCQLAETGGI